MSSSILQGEEGPPPASSRGVGRVGTAKWRKKKLAPNVFGRAEKYGRNFRPVYTKASGGAGQTGYTKKRVPKKEKSKIIGGPLAQNFSRDYWRSVSNIDFQEKTGGLSYSQIKERPKPDNEKAWEDIEYQDNQEDIQYRARASFADAVVLKRNSANQHAKERQLALHANKNLQKTMKQQRDIEQKRNRRNPEIFTVSDEPEPEDPMDIVRQLPIIHAQYPELFEKEVPDEEKEPLAYIPMRPPMVRRAQPVRKTGPITRMHAHPVKTQSNTYWMNPDKLRLMQEDLVLRRQQQLENSK